MRDLSLGKNNLTGAFPAAIDSLAALETLELQENQITSLPSSLGSLPRLRTLNVSKNQLSELPLEALSRCPLTELDAANNKISGTLFPASVISWQTLQSLAISNNKLTSIAESVAVTLPSLKQLFASNNALAEFPPLAGATELLILLLDQNRIKELPDDLFKLRKIRTLDFSANDVKTFDPRLGFMESLEAIKFDGNPLRDRQLAGMSSADLKKTLRGRLAPEIVVDEAQGDLATDFNGIALSDELSEVGAAISTSNGPSAVTTRSGVLDLSKRSLDDFSEDLISNIAGGNPTSLLLTNNSLSIIPLTISHFSSTLHSLSLANNRLSSDAYLTSPLSLPHLESLTLHSTGISTLTPLFTHLSAPSLKTLDVSANRIADITGLRQHFRQLLNFHAGDNKIREIPIESITGLRLLDLSGNELESLEPRLAKLEGTLRELRVTGNLFRVPRWQVLERGTEAVLAWCRERLPIDEEMEEDPEVVRKVVEVDTTEGETTEYESVDGGDDRY